MFRFTRLVAIAALVLSAGACMPVGVSVGQVFPSDDNVEVESMYGLHMRALDDSGIGFEMKLHLIDYDPSLNANLTYGVGGPFYLYGGGGLVNTAAEEGDIVAMAEAGVGVEFPVMVNRYREGAYLFIEGGYFTFAVEEQDGFGAPGVRAGIAYHP